MNVGIRTLRISPRALMRLLQRISAGTPLTAAVDGIPAGVGLGPVRWLEDEQILELDLVYHDWPEDTEGPLLDFQYVEHLGHAGEGPRLRIVGATERARRARP